MNKLLTKIVGVVLGTTMAVGVGVGVAVNNSRGVVDSEVRAGSSVELTFDLSNNPGGWPTSSSSGNYTYTLDDVSYTFSLGDNVYCNSGYLMLKYTTYLGLPAISGKKLTKVVASNSSSCSTSTRVGVSSSSSSASYISGGSYQTWSSTSSSYTYNLSGTTANTMYYLYITNKNCQITGLTLTYESTESATLSSIALSGTYPTSFFIGDEFSHEGMIVTATYSNSDTADVTSNASFSGFDSSVAVQSQEITVSYTEGGVTKTATYNVSIVAKTLSNITISGQKTFFPLNSEFAFGGVVTAHYSNANDADVTESATFSGYNMSSEGNQTVTVSYTEGGVTKTATYSINVAAVSSVEFDATVDSGSSPLAKGIISFACDSGALNNNSEYRLYKNSTTTISSSKTNIVLIEFTGVSSNPVSGFNQVDSGTLTTNGNDGSWSGSTTSVSFVAGTAQVRATKIKVFYETPNKDATINGSSSVVSGEQWTTGGITENEGGATVSGATYSFIAGEGVTISESNPANGTFTATGEGTVTVSATKTGYDIPSKNVSVISSDPYVDVENASGYSGKVISLSFVYGNFDGTLSIVSNNGNVTVGNITDGGEGNESSVSLTLNTAGTSTLSFKDGVNVINTCTISITASEATYTRTAPTKTNFTTSDTFTYGGTITETWNYDPENPIVYTQSDSEVSFELQDSQGNKVADIAVGDEMSTSYSGLSVSVRFNGTQVGNRYSITVSEAFDKTKGEFHIASIDDIKVGAHIVIVAGEEDYVMSAYADGNNFPSAAGAKDSSKGIVAKTNATVLEIEEGLTSGTYAMKTETGKYLNAAGGTGSNPKNYLKVTETIANTSSFTFTKVSDTNWTIVASGGATRNTIRFNTANNPKMFSCYASGGQTNISVYVYKPYSEEAIGYAQYFNTQVGSLCDAEGKTTQENVEAIIAKWSTLASTYGLLTDGGKDYICNPLYRSQADINRMFGMYEKIVSRYNQTNFIQDSNGNEAIELANSLTLNGLSTSTTITTTVIIISVISLATLCGYFLLRKRKEER